MIGAINKSKENWAKQIIEGKFNDGFLTVEEHEFSEEKQIKLSVKRAIDFLNGRGVSTPSEAEVLKLYFSEATPEAMELEELESYQISLGQIVYGDFLKKFFVSIDGYCDWNGEFYKGDSFKKVVEGIEDDDQFAILKVPYKNNFVFRWIGTREKVVKDVVTLHPFGAWVRYELR